MGLLGNEAIRRGVGEEDRVSQSPPRQRGHQKREEGGGWLTMKNHGVEISIAGGVEEMVRASPRWLKAPLLYLLFPQP